MTVSKVIRELQTLIEHRQNVLVKLKEHGNKMQTDLGKELGNVVIQLVEYDLADLQEILAQLKPKHRKTNTAQKD